MSGIKRLLERVRGLLGLGTLGGLTGATVGALWAVAYKLGGSAAPLLPEMLQLGMGGALAGLACGVGFGTLLTTLESKKSLGELPLWRMALLGALAGATVPAVFMLLTSGTIHFVSAPGIVAKVLATFGGLAGAASAGFVALAKSAHREELAVVDEVAGLLEGE